ncbi:MAG: pyruvate:ferredoxin (flavodoxin) oxidoreductase [Muribaculaceae bacterium]|nr:pyruvate:ferredoxin (flavodoxin) oxidoreductase [Muribaculaceae bacterium]
MNKQILDGCTAAAHVAYAMSEIATIYPITPIASMGDTAKKWGMKGRLNLFGQKLEVREMESELGAAGAVHGALAGGALATTFTASQGLMLMIPNMYKIAGELLPAVFHVGCRSLANHALSIFGDHQDVMECRATGFTMLVSASVQETMDLAVVAHIAAIKGSLPVLHFFDGWRTSSEMDTIDVIDYDSIAKIMPYEEVEAFRRRAMNPEHPDTRGTAQNADVYFQNSEATNRYYDAFPSIVQDAMDSLAGITGRQYHLVDYVGAPDADRVIVIMASGAEVAAETSEWLNREKGYKTGVIKVRLYRPFPAEQLLKALPPTVKSIAVLDRTKEPGSVHEPLCQDVMTALFEAGRSDIKVIGGRYGLSSKEFNPSMVKAVFDELSIEQPKRTFTVGINDDVTHLSLATEDSINTLASSDCFQAILYGIGNDGTVGGTKQAASVLAGDPNLYAQAYFSYSAKKSGGYTISQLRVGHSPVTSAYSIIGADYVGCHKTSYVNRFDMLDRIREGGIFVLNSPWSADQMTKFLPQRMRKQIADKKLKFYNIDADSIAAKVGLAPRINMPMETVMLKLAGIMPFEKAYQALQQTIKTAYMHEGGEVVDRNLKAISMALDALHEIDYDSIEGWASTPDQPSTRPAPVYPNAALKNFIEKIHTPCIHGQGDSIPVSALSPDGVIPNGSTAYEHRRIATRVPVWNAEKCVECAECSLVCPHAAIRPFVLSSPEAADAPDTIVTKKAKGSSRLSGYRFRIQNYPEDCLGCSSCSLICPGNALTMTPIDDVLDREMANLEWLKTHVEPKPWLLPAATVKGSQLRGPGLQFSGACAGCGETPYVKLLTQLFGNRLLIANATGCSSIWGADYPSSSYCATDPSGRGPAWANSLFEDNAEFGFGILLAMRHRRRRLEKSVKDLIASSSTPSFLKSPLEAWLNSRDEADASVATGDQLLSILAPMSKENPELKSLLEQSDMLASKSVWAIGGDGWAYDIGFAGLDHVLASGEPIKILVMDTECYSNTGGQLSKATPRAAVAKYAPDGKSTPKKNLGRMMMTYGNVYVASIALGANYQQAIDALTEAERYPGPAIVIAYCPCLNHGIRPGLGHSIIEERRAVEAGYWPLYRFNPLNEESPLTIDSVISGPDNSGHNGSSPLTDSPSYPNAQEPLDDVHGFIMGDDRYMDLQMVSPQRAGILRPRLQEDCNLENEALKKLS